MHTSLSRHCWRVCSKSRHSILVPSHLPQPQCVPASVPLWSAVRYTSLAIGYEDVPAEETDEISPLISVAEETCNTGSSHDQAVFKNVPWTSLTKDGESVKPLALQKSRITFEPDNPTQWVRTLQRRVRIQGHEGAWEAFQGLRDQKLDLPTAGEDAEHLWEPIIAAGSDHVRIKKLWAYVMDLHKRTARTYDNLYAPVISHWLPRSWDHAARMHENFVEAGLLTSDGLHRFFSSVPLTEETSPRLRQFYRRTAPGNVYDTIMGRLCHQRMFHQAALWNRTLFEMHDLPTTADATKPLLRQWKTTGRHDLVSEMLSVLRNKHVSFVDVLEDTFGHRSRMRDKSPEVQVNLSFVSDDFCARAFATKAFTPSFVIRSMSTFGVKVIGPLSLRELALRIRDLLRTFKPDEHDFHGALAREVVVHMQQLKNADIELQQCKFNTVISRLASEDQGQLLEATLDSDQHPDVYEDGNLLERLLLASSRTRELSESHRLLTILSIAHARTSTWAWNEVLQYAIEEANSGSSDKMDFILTSMRKLQIPITISSIRHAYFTLLRPFKPGKRILNTYDERTKRLDTIVRIWMDALKTGSQVPAAAWNYIIRRYGMTMQFDRLERLCLWLAHFYRSSEGRIETARRTSKTQLDHVFPHHTQDAIVEWYFKTMPLFHKPHAQEIERDTRHPLMSPEYLDATSVNGMQHVEHFARGLAILRVLAHNGLDVKQLSIRKAVIHRLRELFGAGRSKLKVNNAAADQNPYTLQYMVLCVQAIWAPVGKLLNASPNLLAEFGSSDDAQRLQVLRKRILGDVFIHSPPALGWDPARRNLGMRYRMSRTLARDVQKVNRMRRPSESRSGAHQRLLSYKRSARRKWLRQRPHGDPNRDIASG